MLVKDSDTVKNIKIKIQENEGIQQMQQILLFNGIQLEDEYTLAKYGIENQSVIYIQSEGQ